MAKRVRASRSSHRPGGQGPSRSKKSVEAAPPADTPAPQLAADADVEAAVEMMESGYTELAVDEVATAPAPVPVTRHRSRRRAKAKSDDLEVRAAAESVWVRDDLRRIGIVSAVLLISLATAWVLFVVLDILRLY